MSRAGYSTDGDQWDLIRWRGAVASALRGKRGQAFLRELVEALDSLPEKRLISGALVCNDGCCALGAVAIARGIDTNPIEGAWRDEIADRFGIAEAMAAEVMYENDEGSMRPETPEQRWQRIRSWAISEMSAETLLPEPPEEPTP